LCPDLVDTGQAVQKTAQRRVVDLTEQVAGLLAGGES
jgi:hypothetical protein